MAETMNVKYGTTVHLPATNNPKHPQCHHSDGNVRGTLTTAPLTCKRCIKRSQKA